MRLALAAAVLVAVPLAACTTGVGPLTPTAIAATSVAVACDDVGLLPCPRQVACSVPA